MAPDDSEEIAQRHLAAVIAANQLRRSSVELVLPQLESWGKVTDGDVALKAPKVTLQVDKLHVKTARDERK